MNDKETDEDMSQKMDSRTRVVSEIAVTREDNGFGDKHDPIPDPLMVPDCPACGSSVIGLNQVRDISGTRGGVRYCLARCTNFDCPHFEGESLTCYYGLIGIQPTDEYDPRPKRDWGNDSKELKNAMFRGSDVGYGLETPISQLGIDGLGPVKLQNLKSAGYETKADLLKVSDAEIGKVKLIGPALVEQIKEIK